MALNVYEEIDLTFFEKLNDKLSLLSVPCGRIVIEFKD